MTPMNGVIAAFTATSLYYLGFSIFKIAADRMERLRGSRPFRMVFLAFSNPLWVLGLLVIFGGIYFQVRALATLPLGKATPYFVAGLVLILLLAVTLFRERLTPREWFCLFLIAVGMVLVAVSVGRSPTLTNGDVEPWKIIAIVLPALFFPYLLVARADRRPDGRHARPISGMAFGVTAGFPLGTAEIAIRGLAAHQHDGLSILSTPHPYVVLISGAISFIILMLGFQRCRVAIVITVATIIAKDYLLIMGTLVYGEPWPGDTRNAALRVGGLLLTGTALLLFPHYDPKSDIGAQEPDSVDADATGTAEGTAASNSASKGSATRSNAVSNPAAEALPMGPGPFTGQSMPSAPLRPPGTAAPTPSRAMPSSPPVRQERPAPPQEQEGPGPWPPPPRTAPRTGPKKPQTVPAGTGARDSVSRPGTSSGRGLPARAPDGSARPAAPVRPGSTSDAATDGAADAGETGASSGSGRAPAAPPPWPPR